jgi:hypothetical protein
MTLPFCLTRKQFQVGDTCSLSATEIAANNVLIHDEGVERVTGGQSNNSMPFYI